MAGSAAGDLATTEATELSVTATSDHTATSRPIDMIITDIFVMNALGIDMPPTGTGTDRIHTATDTLVTAIVTKRGGDHGNSERGRLNSL